MHVSVTRNNLRNLNSCSLSAAVLDMAVQKIFFYPDLYGRLLREVVLCWDAWVFRDHLPGR